MQTVSHLDGHPTKLSPIPSPTGILSHIYTHTHSHTHTHTHSHALPTTHTHSRTLPHTHKHSHTHIHSHTYSHSHTHPPPGRFKKPISYANVYTGQAYDKAIDHIPGKILVNAAFNFMSKLQPAIRVCLSGDKPYFLSPLASTAQKISTSLFFLFLIL